MALFNAAILRNKFDTFENVNEDIIQICYCDSLITGLFIYAVKS